MGLFDEEIGTEMAAHGVELAPLSSDAESLLPRIVARIGREVAVHLYIDTGMSRMGVPHGRAAAWAERIVAIAGVRVQGTFSALTEEDGFDQEQVRRMQEVAREAGSRGVDLGLLHLASSHALFFRPQALLQLVRPGLVLYGAYPAGARQTGGGDLRPAFRLRARVVRVEQLRPGDGVSYGRTYVADRPVWVATLPVGHADGYPRAAVNGSRVEIGGATYPVIGAVSASHTIVELGSEPTVRVGEEATLVGSGSPEVHPNTLAEHAGISVYDVLMHLSSGLPRVLLDREG
jgi:alanine racemase